MLEQFSTYLESLYDKTAPGVTRAVQTDEDGTVLQSASACLWERENIVLTLSHPFDDPDRSFIESSGGRRIPAKVRGWDNRFNLAVLEAPGLGSWADWRPLSSVKPGTLVCARGSDEIHLSLITRVRPSQVSTLGGIISPAVEAQGLISSTGTQSYDGGPLVSMDGSFLGIISSQPRPSGQILGYEQLSSIVSNILEYGTPGNAYLGITASPAVEPGGLHCLLVSAVEPGSPARNAEILPGDYLLSVQDRRLEHPADLMSLIQTMNGGDELIIGLLRGSEEKMIRIVLGGR